jgi:hypothetical protein
LSLKINFVVHLATLGIVAYCRFSVSGSLNAGQDLVCEKEEEYGKQWNISESNQQALNSSCFQK